MRQLKIILSTVLVLAVISSCREDQPNFIDYDNLENGAFLRVISLNSGIFDLLDLGASSYGITLEFDNTAANNSPVGDLQSVDVSVAFVDNTPANGDNSVAKTFLETISASAFAVDATSGKPRTTYSVSANTVLSTLGLVAANLDGTDTFQFTYCLNLSDGRTFCETQGGQNVEGGSFFAAPHQTNVNVVCLLTDGYMIGNYAMVQTIGGQDPFFGSGDRFAAATVAVTEGATPTQRTWNVDYITFTGLAFTIDLVCGNVQVPSQQAGTLGCGGNPLQWVTDAANTATFDASNDAVMTVNFIDDELNNCGLNLPHTLTLTKQ